MNTSVRFTLLSILIISFLTPVSGEAKRRRSRHVSRVAHVSELDQLGRVANLLKTRVDQPGFKSKKNDYACDLKPDQASVMLQAAHAEIDATIAVEAKTRNEMRLKPGSDSQKFSDSSWRECANACSCFIYADIIAKAEPKALTEYDIMSRDYFKQQIENLDQVQSMSCARQVKNFCGSALFKRLKTESQDMEPEPKAESKTDE